MGLRAVRSMANSISRSMELSVPSTICSTIGSTSRFARASGGVGQGFGPGLLIGFILEDAAVPGDGEHRGEQAEQRRGRRKEDGDLGLFLDYEARGERAVDVLQATASDRKSTRLNSSHSQISYAVFCLKKKTERRTRKRTRSEVG